MHTDVLVLGSGMAGLTIAALLAREGLRTQVLEAHEYPGGYAHSFPMGGYRLCAQVHYVFGCGEGQAIHELLRRLDLLDEVRFRRLDPDGFDHVVVAGERFRIPNGFGAWRDRLIARFPEQTRPLTRYFALLTAVRDELDALPERRRMRDWVTAPWRFPNVLRWRSATLQQVYDACKLSPRLQAVLAGQSGDYLLPPAQVSFLLHTALVGGYDAGAWYPERHYGHFVDQLAGRITEQPGCAIAYEREVVGIEVAGDRVTGVRTAGGELWTAERYISNIDPATTAALLLPKRAEWARQLAYPYSCGSFTLYLGVRGLDLREHGFGSWNVWHYPSDDLNAIYRRQIHHNDLSDPFLFLATPSLHSDQPGLTPPGHQLLEVATACDYKAFSRLKAEGSAAYTAAKKLVRDRILDVLEASYVPGLRRHLALRVVGTATTNARYCWAPEGNAYGAALTPEALERVPFVTPFSNLYLVNATAGWPSVCGAVRSGLRLYDRLARDRP